MAHDACIDNAVAWHPIVRSLLQLRRFRCPHDGLFSSTATSSSLDPSLTAKNDAAAAAAARECICLVADVLLDCETAAAASVRDA